MAAVSAKRSVAERWPEKPFKKIIVAGGAREYLVYAFLTTTSKAIYA